MARVLEVQFRHGGRVGIDDGIDVPDDADHADIVALLADIGSNDDDIGLAYRVMDDTGPWTPIGDKWPAEAHMDRWDDGDAEAEWGDTDHWGQEWL